MDGSKEIKVMCPKHKNELAIEREKLLIFGKDYPVIIGTCARCKEKYLSRRLFAANDSCVIKGQQYSYLNELEAIYEDFLRLERIAEQRAKEEERKRQREIAERIKAEKEAEARRIREEAERVKREAEERKRAEIRAEKERREAERKAKQVKIEEKLSEKERKIQCGELKAFHAKKLMYLPKPPVFCYNDGRKVYELSGAVIEFSDYKIRQRAWCCVKCSTAYFLNQERNEVAKYMQNAVIEQTLAPLKLNKRDTGNISEEPVNHAIPQNILYVCKGTIRCKKYGHAVEAATGVMIGKYGKVIKLNTNYCPQCKKYFIGYDEYIHYRSIHGVIMGNFKITNGSFIPFDGDLAQESILHLCGYSVNQVDNLSAFMRQQILQYLIDSRIISKPEIIAYLNGFIRRNGKRVNMGEAVRRWEMDIQWVRDYKMDRQRHFEISNIQKNK